MGFVFLDLEISRGTESFKGVSKRVTKTSQGKPACSVLSGFKTTVQSICRKPYYRVCICPEVYIMHHKNNAFSWKELSTSLYEFSPS